MLRPGQVLILCALGLLTIGVVMVNSAGMRVHPIGEEGFSGITVRSVLLSRSTAYAGLAVAMLTVAALVPVRSLAAISLKRRRLVEHWTDGLPVLTLCALAMLASLALVYIPFLSREVNGSTRWIQLPVAGGLSIQPSEFVKWGLVALMAWYAAFKGDQLRRFFSGLVPALLVVGAIGAAVVLEDLGTGVLIIAAAGLVLFAAGAKLWHFLLFVPPALAGIALAVITSPYRVQRLVAFLDPYADPQGTGYHMIQSMAGVAGGQGPGRGLGFGMQKFGYLPEDQTDFLFAVVCEELGLAGAAIVVSLVAGVLWSALSILRRESEPMLKLFILGVVATFGLQAVINLFVVTGLGPTKGIALPLVSAGGTGWILTAASLGVIVAIERTQPRFEHDEEPEYDELDDADTVTA